MARRGVTQRGVRWEGVAAGGSGMGYWIVRHSGLGRREDTHSSASEVCPRAVWLILWRESIVVQDGPMRTGI